MNSFFLGHLGLGDQIICNALIRNVSQKSKTVFLPVKKHNLLNIKDMLKDLNNINYLNVLDDSEMLKYFDLTKNIVDSVVATGIFGNNFSTNEKYFDQCFYEQAGISYDKRWRDFVYVKNDKKQNELFGNIKDKYIFVHDDQSRNLIIKQNLLNNKFQIYRPIHKLGDNSEYTIFDYIKTLENAEEIHCMDSSFACMIDHIPELYKKKKYIHRYIRKNSNNPYYKNNWEIIND